MHRSTSILTKISSEFESIPISHSICDNHLAIAGQRSSFGRQFNKQSSLLNIRTNQSIVIAPDQQVTKFQADAEKVIIEEVELPPTKIPSKDESESIESRQFSTTCPHFALSSSIIKVEMQQQQYTKDTGNSSVSEKEGMDQVDILRQQNLQSPTHDVDTEARTKSIKHGRDPGGTLSSGPIDRPSISSFIVTTQLPRVEKVKNKHSG